MRKRKLLKKALASPSNLSFAEAIALIEAFGFGLSRTNGSHHIFAHPNIDELVNFQDDGGKAKAYQVRQLLKLVERRDLSIGDDRDEGEDDAS